MEPEYFKRHSLKIHEKPGYVVAGIGWGLPPSFRADQILLNTKEPTGAGNSCIKSCQPTRAELMKERSSLRGTSSQNS